MFLEMKEMEYRAVIKKQTEILVRILNVYGNCFPTIYTVNKWAA